MNSVKALINDIFLMEKGSFRMDNGPDNQLWELARESSRDLSNIIKSIGHRRRVEILSYLAKDEHEYSWILRMSGISKTALANHLNILIENGLIQRLERGSYRITPDGVAILRAITTAYANSIVRGQNQKRQLLEKYAKRGINGGRKMREIKKLRWQPRWVTHLGCVEGCLKNLKHKISTGWLYGGTGHAFIINIDKDLCPSGPTAWRTMMLYELAPNLGYRVDGVFAQRNNPEFPKLQEKAWNHAKDCIDNSIPCYGWELDAPEYYAIHGYDNVGYYYSGPGFDDGTGPKPWKDVGTSQIGILEIYSIRIVEAKDPQKTIRDALTKALYHSKNPEDIILPNYRSGLKGYDLWISAIQDGSALSMGHSYNTAVWAECRKYAVEFLKEARKYVNGNIRRLIDDARNSYEIVSRSLESIQKEYPFSASLPPEPLGIDEKTSSTVEELMKARTAEAEGLNLIEEIIREMN